MELPQGMFGISLATYLLPTLAGLAAQKKYPEFRETLRQGVGHLAFANLLATAVATALAEPIVRLLFERGKFGPDATHRVALALTCLAPGLLMFSMNNILARAFFALNDIKTPMKISVFCLALNLVLAFFAVKQFQLVHIGGEVGLAIANTVSAVFNMTLLLYTLRRKMGRLDMAQLKATILVLVSDAVLAGIVAVLASFLWEHEIGHRTLPAKLGAVFVPGALAGLVYWVVAFWMNVPGAREMTLLIAQRLGRRAK
jgi:putative peptidoglycan lipid II flippase